jgi:Protein phosphatase 2C
MSRRAGQVINSDRNDVLLRVAASVLAVVPLGLVVFVVVRNVLLGLVALVFGMIAGIAVVFAVLESEAVAGRRRGEQPTYRQPEPTGSAVPRYSPPVQPPPLTSTAVASIRSREPAGYVATRSATVVADRPDPLPEGGYLLGPGSRAGQAAWHLPIRSGQPGIAVDAARLGDLEVRAASVIGPAHRCEEPAVARQDAYVLARDSRGAHLVIAVADGLSDSTHSELGARVAVSTAARELSAALDRSGDPSAVDARALFTTVAREISGTGRGRGLVERDLCCLLIVAVVPAVAEPDGFRQIWTAQIGDVSLWTHDPEWSRQTGIMKSGLDRNTVSAVLPFHPGKVVTSRLSVPPGYGIGVVTDGVGDLLSDVAEASGFFADRWASPPHPAEFLADLCVDAPGQDDDRTAVVVWCGAGGPAARRSR